MESQVIKVEGWLGFRVEGQQGLRVTGRVSLLTVRLHGFPTLNHELRYVIERRLNIAAFLLLLAKKACNCGYMSSLARSKAMIGVQG